MTDHKQKLMSLQAELQERVSKIDSDLHNRSTSSKFSEQVVDSQNDDVLRNLKNEALFELQQIEMALARISNNQYGICQHCQGEISAERLDAVPYASRCRDCAA